jgi:hypothetical protein
LDSIAVFGVFAIVSGLSATAATFMVVTRPSMAGIEQAIAVV